MEKIQIGCDKIVAAELVRQITGAPSLSMARSVITTCEVTVNGVPVEMSDEIFLGEEPKEVVITNGKGKAKTWMVGK